MAASFDDLMKLLVPADITAAYDAHKIVLNDVNIATNELLTTYTTGGGLNETLLETTTYFTEFNDKIREGTIDLTTFLDLVKSKGGDFETALDKMATASKKSAHETGRMIASKIQETKNIKTNATALKDAAALQAKAAASLGTIGGVTTVNVNGTNVTVTGGGGGSGGTTTGGRRGARGGRSAGMEALKMVGSAALDLVKKGWDGMKQLEEAFRPLNAQMGLSTEQQEGFINSMNRSAVETTREFGKSAKDLGEIQGKIFSETGRVQVMTSKQIEKVAGMAKLVGNQGAATFVSQMDKVGASTTQAAKNFETIRVVAGKSGVDMVKATGLVEKHIQKAQSYAFKNGVQSLAQMATKALQMRMSMEEVFKFTEKNKSVESAVTNAAQAQVLGGQFSSFANPLENLYNSLYDQEATQSRLLDLGSDVMRFDKASGTMKYKSASDQLRAEAFAQSQGLDINELMSGWTRTGLGKQMEKDLGSSLDYLGKDKDLVKSKASWDEEMGGWTTAITRKNEKTGEWETVNRLIDQLSDDDISTLKADEVQDTKKIAQSTMSMDQKMDALLESLKTAASAWGYEKLGETIHKGLDGLRGFFGKLTLGQQAIGGAAVMAGGPMASLLAKKTLGGVKNAVGAFSKVGKIAARGSRMGIGRGAVAARAGKNMLKMGKGSGILAGVISAGVEGYDQWKQGNFKKGSGKQGRAIGSTAGAGIGGGLGAWGGAAGGAAIGTMILPGIGTAIGGLLGAAVGGLAGSKWGKSIGNSIGKFFDEGSGKALGDWSKKAWGSVSEFGKNAWEGTKGVWSKIKEGGANVGGFMGKVFENVSVKGKQFGGIFTSLFKGDLTGALVNARLLVKNVGDDLKKVWGGLKTLRNNVVDGIVKIGTDVGNWISTAFGNITSGEWWLGKLKGVGDGIMSFFSSIGEWVGGKISGIGNFIGEAWGKITDPSWWMDKINSIWVTIADGFKKGIDWLGDIVNPMNWGWVKKVITWGQNLKLIAKGAWDESEVIASNLDAKTQTYADREVQDMIKTPKGDIYTDPKDVIMAVKPGGSLSSFFTNSVPQQSGMGGVGGTITIPPITINISGSIRLEGTNQSLDMSSLSKNRGFVDAITNAVSEGINRNMNSGRSNVSGGQHLGKYSRGQF